MNYTDESTKTLQGLSGRLWMRFCRQAVELLGGRIWIESDPDAPSHMFGFTIRNGTISNKI